MKCLSYCCLTALFIAHSSLADAIGTDVVDLPFVIDTPVESRSISYENPTGARGQGGTTASKLGVGRKGRPCKTIAPGETSVLCDITGPGVIRHIWMTTRGNPINLRRIPVL